MDTIYKKYEPIFGAWYIKEKIGQGSVGQVFLIEREEPGFTYQSALKAITVPPDQSDIKTVMGNGLTYAETTHYYKTFMDTLSNELTTMAKLKGQSNIVSYEDHMVIRHEDEIGWDILIRMELLEPLLDHYNEKKLTEDDVLKLGVDMCRALELCGKYGVIHRDIKPENIFISPTGDFKLGDFGISRMIEDTREGLSRKGTFTYMAPEVFNGKSYGPSADLYSLGLVMYKFLNGGRNAFMPDAPAQIEYDDNDKAFFKRMSGEAIPEPAMGSETLKKVVLKACAFSPEDRYESVSAMREELEEIVFRQRSSEKTKAAGTVQVTPKKRRFLLPLIIAIIAVAAVAAFFALKPDPVTGIGGIGTSEEILIGGTLSPEYTIEPESAGDVEMTFASGAESVFTVDKNGRIRAIGVGKGPLTITAGEYTEDVDITVSPKVKKIKGVKSRIELYTGDKYQLEPRLLPSKYSKEKITYRSLRKKVATVSSKGLITARKKGVCRIRISAGGCSRTIKVIVTDRPAVQENYSAPSYSNNSGNTTKNKSKSNSSTNSNKNKDSSQSKDSDTKKPANDSGEGYFDSDDDEYF